MKIIPFILLIGLAFGATATLNAQGGYPILVLNDSFSHAQPKGSKITPQKYQLHSLKGFELDCSRYDFTLIQSLNEGRMPESIFIICQSGNYKVKLNPEGITIVDASTMTPVDGPTKKFRSFAAGDTPILGIGTLARGKKGPDMRTYWVSMINVTL